MNAWPLSFVAVGAGTLVHAVAGIFMPDPPRVRKFRRGGTHA
jgi:hypothetical protein